MKQYRWLVALILGALLLVACGVQEAAVPGEVALATMEYPKDISLDVTTVPEDSTVLDYGMVPLAANTTAIEGCDYVWKVDLPVPPDATDTILAPEGFIGEITFSVTGNKEDGYFIEVTDTVDGYTVVIERAYFGIGNDARKFTFDPGVTYAGPLPAPINPSDQAGDISHTHFCYNLEEDPTKELQDLTVTKTAETRFERDVEWALTKTVNDKELEEFFGGPGETFNANWFVQAELVKDELSNYTVSGLITIDNPNPTIVQVRISDVLSKEDVDLDPNPVLIQCPAPAEGEPFVGDPSPVTAFVPAEANGVLGSLVCAYQTGDLGGEVADLNTVTVEVLDYEVPEGYAEEPVIGGATFDIEVKWGAPVLTGEDPNPLFVDIYKDIFNQDGNILETTTLSATEVFVCSTELEDYFDEYGVYTGYKVTATNTATLKGDDGFPGPDLTESATVTLECNLAFETAWAANGDEPGELRYNRRGNWATYVEYDVKTTTLFAGQTVAVGTVSFSAVDVDDNVTITVTLKSGWLFENVAENLKVQDYEFAPSGNPEVGLFDHKLDCPSDPLMPGTCSIVVPANSFYGVHVNVVGYSE